MPLMRRYARKTQLAPKRRPTAKMVTDSAGPGTELAKILARFGFKDRPGCKCALHAEMMDRWGCEECLRRLNEITAWLQQEAHARGLPFSAVLARQLIKRAIAQAKRKAS